MRYLKTFVVGLTLLVSACGGGGGDPDLGPPQIGTGAPPAGATGTPYPDYTFRVTSGGVSPFTWSETGALPPGLALSPTGQLSGTPVTAGTYDVTIMVTDSSTPVLTATLPISIKIDAMSVSPGQEPPAGLHGTPYYFSFGTTGGNLPISWAVTDGALPPGLTLNSHGTLDGTPTTASSTPFAFTVTATDSSTPTPATDSVAYSITVSEPAPPSIQELPRPPTAIVGSPYSFQFSAIDGLAPLVWTATAAPMGGLDISPEGVLNGTPSTAGAFPITLTVKDALNQSSPAVHSTVHVAIARPEATFVQTGSMNVARTGHTATLLLDGRVLIAGGGPASAELYDATSQTFAFTGPTTLTQDVRSATLLANSSLPNYGKVLMSGGGEVISELFDPATGTFTATGSMLAQHLGQSATLLQNGLVLIAGGETAKAELFDPSSGTFTATGNMTISRSGHTATLLSNGRVLITGGVQDFGPGTVPIPIGEGVASAEIYDPASGTFTATGSMNEGRSGHTATLLNDGTVLVIGTTETVEVFNPGVGTFSVVGEPLAARCDQIAATLRNDGTVLVTGGRACGRGHASRGFVQFFAPESGGFVDTSPLITARDRHTATLLGDGSVLITGGTQNSYVCHHDGYVTHCSSSSTVLASAELFK